MSLRRALLVGLVLVLAGCTLPIVGNAPSYPERPAQLNDSSVVDYVEQYETAERYRALFENQWGIEFGCGTATPTELDDGYFVRTLCTVTQGPRGSNGGPPAAYFVNGSATAKVNTGTLIEAPNSTYPGGQDTKGVTGESVYVYNFARADRSLSVTIEPVDASAPKSRFTNSTTLGGRAFVVYHFDYIRRGTYSLTGSIGDRTLSEQWQVGEPQAERNDEIGIVMTPDGRTYVVPIVSLY